MSGIDTEVVDRVAEEIAEGRVEERPVEEGLVADLHELYRELNIRNCRETLHEAVVLREELATSAFDRAEGLRYLGRLLRAGLVPRLMRPFFLEQIAKLMNMLLSDTRRAYLSAQPFIDRMLQYQPPIQSFGILILWKWCAVGNDTVTDCAPLTVFTHRTDCQIDARAV